MVYALITSKKAQNVVKTSVVTTLVTPILLKLGMSKQTPANTEFNAQEKVQMPKVSQH